MSGIETDLDKAHARMRAAPDDGKARLDFFARIADTEVFLLLETEMRDQTMTPASFPLDEGTVVLIFDREERLADFANSAAPYAALSGRVVIALAASEGLGVGINLGVAQSSILLPPGDIVWLADILERSPEEARDRPVSVVPLSDLPADLLSALDRKLASAAGLAEYACLSAVTYQGDRCGTLLAFVDAHEHAEQALANAVSEALVFSGLDNADLDVVFLRSDDPMIAPLLEQGVRFDLPSRPEPKGQSPRAPGMDPDTPPRLR